MYIGEAGSEEHYKKMSDEFETRSETLTKTAHQVALAYNGSEEQRMRSLNLAADKVRSFVHVFQRLYYNVFISYAADRVDPADSEGGWYSVQPPRERQRCAVVPADEEAVAGSGTRTASECREGGRPESSCPRSGFATSCIRV